VRPQSMSSGCVNVLFTTTYTAFLIEFVALPSRSRPQLLLS
jgi:hypothetical protein